jgi:RNA polymerase sigma-70 factor, ECF subfamily
LVAGLAAGEVEVIRVLYQRYGGLAYSLAVRILGDHGRAEDVVRDAFMRIWARADSFDATRGSLRSWLLTTIRNLAIDYLRDRAGRQRQELELSRELPARGWRRRSWLGTARPSATP